MKNVETSFSLANPKRSTRKMVETREVDLDSELMKKVNDVAERALNNTTKSRSKRSSPGADVQLERPQLSLNLFPDETRAVPNIILRSALFAAAGKGIGSKTVRQKRVRQMYVDGLIPCLDGDRYSITYTGERLDQADRDIYELLVYLCKEQPIGTTCIFSANHFLTLLGRPAGTSGYTWLEEGFKRLVTGAVTVEFSPTKQGKAEKIFTGHLVDSIKQNKTTKKWAVRLGPDLFDLYTQGARFTYYDASHRLALKKLPLASWLQGFYCTHIEQIPLSLEALHVLCGSENSSLRSFKQEVTKACEKLESLGIFLGWNWIGKGQTAKLYATSKLNESQLAYKQKKAQALEKIPA